MVHLHCVAVDNLAIESRREFHSELLTVINAIAHDNKGMQLTWDLPVPVAPIMVMRGFRGCGPLILKSGRESLSIHDSFAIDT